MTDKRFEIVGIKPVPEKKNGKKDRRSMGKPLFSIVLLTVIVSGCLGCRFFITKDPFYMDLANYNRRPDHEFLFGTDTMGRDIFSMIWYGGRISLFIGLVSAALSVFIAMLYGSVSGLAPRWLDALMMRLVEILICIPELLLVALLQAIFGRTNVIHISLVIGLTGWMRIAKVVRTEVRQIRNCGYVTASRCMGAGFFYILWKHLIPNFLPSIMFMAVMNVRNGIITESTLSFMGMGLPLEIISWGSMLQLAEKAAPSGCWWMIVIPGAFLVTALVSITNVGNFLRKTLNRGQNHFLCYYSRPESRS